LGPREGENNSDHSLKDKAGMTFEQKRTALSSVIALTSVTAVIALMLIRFPAYAKAEHPSGRLRYRL
ncbi:MAG: hypothetical protein WBF47_22795, partial [Xanthobacteraceae bacterium]